MGELHTDTGTERSPEVASRRPSAPPRSRTAMLRAAFEILVTKRKTVIGKAAACVCFVAALPLLVLFSAVLLKSRGGVQKDPTSEYVYPLF